ncbi:PAS/PAC sensor signal transduction histidine kinase [Faunimonas pinastri]|uniref:histidine kinase n=1 Tax=Faunimonas pinastri TaxID=1855383 RepID=A0A1H9EAA2_9HYPH|nr:PAS domain-containing sensor histidine kinase [Faunimonas pinastri]SEQ22512.1 PAS/PAC sensor signal transduction histidine kinase [Faunimonas pinastri]
MFENAPCALLSLDARGYIVRTNRALTAWTGYAPETIAGKRFLELLSVSGRIFHETHFVPLLRMHGSADEIALDLVRADGTHLPVLVNAVEERDGAGELCSIRVAIFKATERRRYERELVAAQSEARMLQGQLEIANVALERKLGEERDLGRLREEFIAVLGHDLRNPLASTRSGARLLAREVSSERATVILTHMEASTVRMSALIDNVLDFARGRLGGGITLDLAASQPLEPVLRQVVDELRYGTGREILTDFALTEPVACDHQRIAQLVSNLLGNALTHGAEDQPISMTARTDSGVLSISVANGGTPISPSAMEHLFQPFFRGGIQPSKQGLGLGLHIASEIAKAHRGTLVAQSSSSETRFTFSMPLTDIGAEEHDG